MSVNENETTNDSNQFKRYLMMAAAGLVAVIVLPFVIGLVIALLSTNPESTAETIGVIRDVVIIIMALEAILIILALTVLILQVTRLIVMIQNEITPIVTDTKETLNTAKGTAQFVGKNVSAPLIRFQAFFAGFVVFVRELAGIRRAVRRNPREEITSGE